MIEEDLLNDGNLARLLAEELKRERLNNNPKLIENNLYYNYILTDKEINNIIKEYKEQKNIYDTNDYARTPQRPIYQAPTAQEMESARTKFMQDDNQVLTLSTPRYLREDTDVIIASITRNINSIAYATNFTDKVKQTAIIEAKKQGYVFHSGTPLFMLQNPQLIKQSIEKDINTIVFVPYDAITNDLVSYAITLALNNNYILSSASPTFLKTNIEIIKQTLRLDKNSGINVIWDEITPEQLTEIEKYIIDNKLDYIMNAKSPAYFKRNVDLCIISAKNDPKSVSYFDWDYIDKIEEARKKIIDALVEQNYVLDYNSPDALKGSSKICLSSIKNNIHSAKYFSEDMQHFITGDIEKIPVENENDKKIKKDLYEIRHYLIQNGFYSLEQMGEFDVTVLKDEILLEYYLKQLGMPKDTNNEELKIFFDRVKDFFKKIFLTPISVSDTRKVFQMVAVKKWEEYRKENNDYYTNIFNRICDSLEKIIILLVL